MAAPNVHLEIKEIEGDSEVKGYEKQIDCMSWSWGVSQSANMHVSSGGASGVSHVQDIAVSKNMDAASVNLAYFCAKGKHMPEAKLHCTKSAGDDNRIEWYTLTMTDVIISSVSQNGGGPDSMGSEQVTLNFGKIQMQFFKQSATGGSEAGPDQTYDIRKAVGE